MGVRTLDNSFPIVGFWDTEVKGRSRIEERFSRISNEIWEVRTIKVVLIGSQRIKDWFDFLRCIFSDYNIRGTKNLERISSNDPLLLVCEKETNHVIAELFFYNYRE